MITPKIGLPGQIYNYPGGHEQIRAGQVTKLNSSTNVDARHVGGTSDDTSLVFVDIGGTTPGGTTAYFQAIDCTT